jgi:hypothetical protein
MTTTMKTSEGGGAPMLKKSDESKSDISEKDRSESDKTKIEKLDPKPKRGANSQTNNKKIDRNFGDSGFFRPGNEDRDRTLNSGGQNEEEIKKLGNLIDKWDPIFWDGEDGDPKRQSFPKTKNDSPSRKDRDMFGPEKTDSLDEESTTETIIATTTTTKIISEITTSKKLLKEQQTTETTNATVANSSIESSNIESSHIESSNIENSTILGNILAKNVTLSSSSESNLENSNQTSTTTHTDNMQHLADMAHKFWVRLSIYCF